MADTRSEQRPQRIQRKRAKGWKMPPNTVYVGRPTKWGNPYINWPQASDAVDLFRKFMNKGGYVSKEEVRAELRGKNLACWCPLVDKDGNPVPCHADVLLEIANAQ